MSDVSILPAIIPQSLEHLRAESSRVAACAPVIQIDLVDGVFTPHVSWPYAAEEGVGVVADIAEALPPAMEYELDLMVANPLSLMEHLGSERLARIILHYESFRDAEEARRAVGAARAYAPEVFFALSNDTPLTALDPFIHDIDGVQCMGIAEIGRQGVAFDERVLSRLTALRRAHPSLVLSVDGSVNGNTIAALRAAGADRFIAGSAIFNTADPCAAYGALAAQVAVR